MRIEIEIPKEFENHFNEDKFKDSFERVISDIENGDCLCIGRYELETMEMLESAFENSKIAYDVDKVVEKLEIERKTANNTYNLFNMNVDLGRIFGLEKAIEIVKQGGASDDACDWSE